MRHTREAARHDDAQLGVPEWPAAAVPRRDVVAALEASDRVPLVVVSAPAGSGKTVAVAEWARERVSGPVCWIAFEDGDPSFWTPVLAALRGRGLPVPEDWAVPVGGVLGSQRLAVLVDLLLAAPERFTVVADGFQLTSAALARELDALLRRSRGRLRLVLVGRVDPVLLVHRYRLTESVLELRAPDLAFSDDEARRLLEDAGVVLDGAAVHELNRRLSGWAAGLRFAARALAESADSARYVDTVVEQTADINEFLVGEVLDVEAPAVRRFLLDTCVTDMFCVDLVEEVAGSSAVPVMAALVDRKAFVEAVPGRPDCFRYFPFFRNLLLARLSYEAPDRLVELRRSAARWYRRHGRWARSLAELAKVGDWDRLCVQLVADGLVGNLLIEDRGGPLGALARELPADLDAPEAHAVRAALALGRGEAGRPRCDRELAVAGEAARRAGGDRGDDPALLASLAVTDALRSALTEDCATAEAAVTTGEALLAGSPITPVGPPSPGLATVLVFARGLLALRTGDLARARTALARAADEATRGSAAAFRADCLGRLAVADALHGALATAARHAEDALAITGPPGSGPHDPPPSAHVALAWVAMERCDDELVADHTAAASVTGGLSADPFCRALVEAPAAVLAHARGHTRSAVGRLEVAADAAARRDPWLADLLRVEVARLSLSTGDPEHALGVLDGVQRPDRPEPQVAAAAALVEQGRPRPRHGAVLHDGSAPLGSQVGGLLVEAARAAQQSSTGEARVALTRALRLAAPERMRRPFRESGGSVERLLASDARLVSGHEWLQQARPHGSVARDGSGEWVVVEALTPKELEVLGHLAELLTTDEIAQKMFVSVNTVRTHIRNILHKLGVSRRNAAIRRARELGLLDADRW